MAWEYPVASMRYLKTVSLLAAASAFYLLIAGSQVNSWQAALSVPDWPLSYGHLLAPSWPGNLFYEQHHRATAASTVVLFALVLVGLARRRELAAARRLGWWAAAALAAQTLMGGLIVLKLNPPWLGASHVVLAIVTVVLIAVTALLVWRDPVREDLPEPRDTGLERIERRAALGLGLLGLQIALGSLARHPPAGELAFIATLLAHLFVGLVLIVWTSLVGLSAGRSRRMGRARAWGWVLVLVAALQLAVGAWVFVVAPEPFAESWPPPSGFPAAHALHIVLAAALATALVAVRIESRQRTRAC